MPIGVYPRKTWICIVPACGRKGRALGYCSPHYQRFKKQSILPNSEPIRQETGKTKLLEYKTWRAIKARCYNPNYKQFNDYGGRGIEVSDEWLDSFWTFLRDMGPRPSLKHSINRINNSEGYSKENCEWALAETQNRNKRKYTKRKDCRDV
jgi:hypothetical protein